jgi:hypothetical protein
MSTEEKIKLHADINAAFLALGRLVDGPHKPEHVGEQLRKDCMDAMAGLSVASARLEAEVGTDNL